MAGGCGGSDYVKGSKVKYVVAGIHMMGGSCGWTSTVFIS